MFPNYLIMITMTDQALTAAYGKTGAEAGMRQGNLIHRGDEVQYLLPLHQPVREI